MRANNETVLQWHHDQGLLGGPVHKVHMWHNAPATGPAVEGARRFINKPNFHELTSVAVGARIVYHTTDNKEVRGSPAWWRQVPRWHQLADGSTAGAMCSHKSCLQC